MTTHAIKFLYQGYDFIQEREWRQERERRICLINEIQKTWTLYAFYLKADPVDSVWQGIPEAR